MKNLHSRIRHKIGTPAAWPQPQKSRSAPPSKDSDRARSGPKLAASDPTSIEPEKLRYYHAPHVAGIGNVYPVGLSGLAKCEWDHATLIYFISSTVLDHKDTILKRFLPEITNPEERVNILEIFRLAELVWGVFDHEKRVYLDPSGHYRGVAMAGPTVLLKCEQYASWLRDHGVHCGWLPGIASASHDSDRDLLCFICHGLYKYAGKIAFLDTPANRPLLKKLELAEAMVMIESVVEEDGGSTEQDPETHPENEGRGSPLQRHAASLKAKYYLEQMKNGML